MSKFSERLVNARRICGKTQKALADVLGVKANTISAYEKGKAVPSIDSAAKLANELNVSLDWLCGMNDNKQCANNQTKSVVEFCKYFFELTASCPELGIDVEAEPNNFFGENVTLSFKGERDMLEDWARVIGLLKTGVLTQEMYKTLIDGIISKYQGLEESLPF